MARSCALTSVASLLAELVGRKEAAMRERLRDLYREASAKKGEKRAEWCAEKLLCSSAALGSELVGG